MFEAKRFSHTQRLVLEGTLETVFPLFGPIGEKAWAMGWNPRIVYSESPLADSPGTIFTSPHHGDTQTIWYVSRFDHQRHEIEYLRVTPGVHLAVLVITCEPLADGKTAANVTYTFTALSEAGNAALEQLAERHPAMVDQWEQTINQHLRGAAGE